MSGYLATLGAGSSPAGESNAFATGAAIVAERGVERQRSNWARAAALERSLPLGAATFTAIGKGTLDCVALGHFFPPASLGGLPREDPTTLSLSSAGAISVSAGSTSTSRARANNVLRSTADVCLAWFHFSRVLMGAFPEQQHLPQALADWESELRRCGTELYLPVSQLLHIVAILFQKATSRWLTQGAFNFDADLLDGTLSRHIHNASTELRVRQLVAATQRSLVKRGGDGGGRGGTDQRGGKRHKAGSARGGGDNKGSGGGTQFSASNSERWAKVNAALASWQRLCARLF